MITRLEPLIRVRAVLHHPLLQLTRGGGGGHGGSFSGGFSSGPSGALIGGDDWIACGGLLAALGWALVYNSLIRPRLAPAALRFLEGRRAVPNAKRKPVLAALGIVIGVAGCTALVIGFTS
jgi:hypothetical protein